ncbi:hypothetical protein ACFFP0_26290 [Rhizobium puerariae]|uniref:Uncharacterized protein n=1 Tax=Rhizobium puerariae TaxID=1585791 RepID=A0ABV6AP11_9HYPH
MQSRDDTDGYGRYGADIAVIHPGRIRTRPDGPSRRGDAVRKEWRGLFYNFVTEMKNGRKTL